MKVLGQLGYLSVFHDTEREGDILAVSNPFSILILSDLSPSKVNGFFPVFSASASNFG